jgi:putative oxidoreductase
VVPYEVMSLNGLAGIIETVGGILLLVGLFSRAVAFLAAGEMAVAYFKVHTVRSIFPIANGGDNVVLFCFVYLYLVFAGAGPWSLDAVIARRRH